MFTNKKDLLIRENWALRAGDSIGFRAVSGLSAKWRPAGYEVRFDGGCAVIVLRGVLWPSHELILIQQ